MAERVYYVYKDDKGDYYFYDTESGTSTYDRPTSGSFLDPENDQPVTVPTKHSKRSKKVGRQTSVEWAGTPEPSPPPSREARHTMSVITTSKAVSAPISSALAAPVASSFPTCASLSRPPALKDPGDSKFQIREYADQFFRTHKEGSVFSRKKVSADAITNWQGEPIHAPLLQTHTKVSEKLAVEAFKLILGFSGKAGTQAQATKIVEMMISCPDVRDEIYFQLIKQTRGNSDRECLVRVWQLFVIVASLIPSSAAADDWIKSHICRSAQHPSQKVMDLVQFAFIRFSVTMTRNKAPASVTPALIQSISGELENGKQSFGVSLYEQMLHQRSTHPNLPIPYVLHVMTERLIEKGAEKTEGIFRIPGNGKKVLELEAQVNVGNLALRDGDLHDVGSLFKSWFAKLGEPIVHESLVDSLKAAAEAQKGFLPFLESLPQPHFISLKYLIGFLQRLSKFADVTRMGAKNFAMVFAPNIVSLDSVKDPMQIASLTDMIQEFLAWLIGTWDTADIYPVPEPLLGN
jgi:hypothetical protein